MATKSVDDLIKVLKTQRAYLLVMQKEMSDHFNKENTRINGLVFEIDRVLPKEKE